MAHFSPCAVPTCRTDVAPWVFIGGSQDPPGVMGTGVGKVPGWGWLILLLHFLQTQFVIVLYLTCTAVNAVVVCAGHCRQLNCRGLWRCWNLLKELFCLCLSCVPFFVLLLAMVISDTNF